MKNGLTRTFLGLTGTMVVCLFGVAMAGGQAAPPAAPARPAPPAAQAPAAPQPGTLMSDQVFKNVQVLKGIPVDEFLGTMGVFSASLGMSCENCHAGNDKGWDTYAADVWPTKATARRMITMMAGINRANFQGRQIVTCFTCHRGSQTPKYTPSLDLLYGTPPEPEPSDPFMQAPGQPTADQVLDKYLQALGGAQKLAALTSFTAKGTNAGYGPEQEKRAVEIYAKAPGQRTVVIHTENGDSTAVVDGRSGWFSAPLRPVPVLTLTGQDLEGVKLEAQLLFPATIKQALSNWRVGFTMSIDDKEVQPVQGTTPGGALATLFFDTKTGLLARLVRYSDSPVGHLVTRIDYSDYRDVAGVKMPFHWTSSWLDGRENFDLTGVQPNVAIPATRFATPPPSVVPLSKPATP